MEKEMKAEVDPVEKGLLKKEVIDFKWKGGRLAQLLGSDSTLSNMIYEAGIPYLEVKPNKKDSFVAISTARRKWSTTHVTINGIPVRRYDITVGRKAFPSREAFDIYDRIAMHIRNITAT